MVFVKAPRVGQVKTRLARAIGPEAACAAYERMAETLLANVSGLRNVVLRFTPDDAEKEITRWMQPSWVLQSQGAGDLGDRMNAAFQDAFSQGAKRVVLIGSDCPVVTPNDINEAWDALGSFDVVLGPAVDGGYWLIGLRAVQQHLFEGIKWSSPEVFEATLRRTKELGLKVQLLRTLADVDTEQDWKRFSSKQGSALGPNLGNW